MINYYLLTKPGIILGNLITFAAGFLLASQGGLQWALFVMTLLGLTLIIASACVLNNYIDRAIDRRMERTKKRPLAQGLIAKGQALFFASALAALGIGILAIGTNLLTLCMAGIGFFVYVVLYSFWKSHTLYATAIGSIAGAIPPVVGYTAVSHRLDLGALILFLMLVAWQMPHFFAITLTHFEDYKKASLPVLPVRKGIMRTKIHMVLYILAFLPIALSLTFFRYTGYFYFLVALTGGLVWLWLCLQGFYSQNDRLWGQQMFRRSLWVITSVCLMMALDH